MTGSAIRLGPGIRVLVTGASSGIGYATTREFAARGCRVVAVARDSDALTALRRHTGALPLPVDLTDPNAADDVLGSAGPVDVLVCNAGIGWAGPLSAMPGHDVDALLRLNVTATVRLVHAALPGMLARGRGHLVVVSSIAGYMAVADEAVYSATKAAVTALASAVRHEVADRGVGVTVVVPGVVDTPFFTRRGTPYARTVPKPVSADSVAQRLVRAVENGRTEVFVPRWLQFPARLRGLAPGLSDLLQRRFG